MLSPWSEAKGAGSVKESTIAARELTSSSAMRASAVGKVPPGAAVHARARPPCYYTPSRWACTECARSGYPPQAGASPTASRAEHPSLGEQEIRHPERSEGPP